MERLDFSSAAKILWGHFNNGDTSSQTTKTGWLFEGYLNSRQDIPALDEGAVNRWLKGVARVSPEIVSFYLGQGGFEELSYSIETYFLPILDDPAMVTQELYHLVQQDASLSDFKKEELYQGYPCRSPEQQTDYIAKILLFGMSRTFVSRKIAARTALPTALSPLAADRIFTNHVPNPCKHFCGREAELEELHTLLRQAGKVFLYGIAGIGKSELARAYAARHRDDFRNIIYISYSGSLRRDIASIGFVDDSSGDDEELRYRKHSRFLEQMKSDTLLIIDNFNATEQQDDALYDVLNYRCRVLFTTRYYFEEYTLFPVSEIQDAEVLFNLIAAFYKKANAHRQTILKIIEVVHRHTYLVELVGRLLQKGSIFAPEILLHKLEQQKTGMDAEDTISIGKDGRIISEIYRRHIRLLFALFRLNNSQQTIMRCMALIPLTGIADETLAAWLELHTMDDVNLLIRYGLIHDDERQFSLHPLMKEVVISELKPSCRNCSIMLENIHTVCLLPEQDPQQYRLAFEIVEQTMESLINDNTEVYLLLLHDAFNKMESFLYYEGMQTVVKKLEEILADPLQGSQRDRVLLLSEKAHLARREKKLDLAKELFRQAVENLPQSTEKMAAYLEMNTRASYGGICRETMDYAEAKKQMKAAMNIAALYDLTFTDDYIALKTNYAVMLAKTDGIEPAKEILRQVASEVQQRYGIYSLPFAMIVEAAGSIYINRSDFKTALPLYQAALVIYTQIYSSMPEAIQEKTNRFTNIFLLAGCKKKKPFKKLPDSIPENLI